MGLVLVGMLVASMFLLGLWQRRRSKKRFNEAKRKLGELNSMLESEIDWIIV